MLILESEIIKWVASSVGTAIGLTLLWNLVDSYAAKFLLNVAPKYFMPWVIKQFQKLDDIIDDAKIRNPKLVSSISAFETQLIRVAEKFIETLKK